MGSDGSYVTPPQASPALIPASAPMEDDDPEDLYGLQEVAGESEGRPPLEVVDLTAETEVPTVINFNSAGTQQKVGEC